MRGAKRSSAHSSSVLRLLALELDRELARLQLVDQLDRCTHAAASSFARVLLRRLEAGQHAELARRSVASQNGRERSRRRRARRASRATRPSTRCVELLGRHAPEERAPDRRVRAEAAAHEDVVGLAALALLVARGRALEAEVADPVLRAGVRAAVEVQPQVGDLACRSAPRGARSSRPSRVFVSVTEKLQCGSPVQRDRAAAHAVRRRAGSRSRRAPRRPSSTLRLGHVRDDEVLLARDADVAADRSARSATAIIWSPEMSPRWTGTPT